MLLSSSCTRMHHLPGWPRVCTPCLYSGIPLWFLRASYVGPGHHRGTASEDGLFKPPQKAFHSVKLFRARLQVLTGNAKICKFKRVENVNFSERTLLRSTTPLGTLYTSSHVKIFQIEHQARFFLLIDNKLSRSLESTRHLWQWPTFDANPHQHLTFLFSFVFPRLVIFNIILDYIRYLRIGKLFCRTQWSPKNTTPITGGTDDTPDFLWTDTKGIPGSSQVSVLWAVCSLN